MGIFCFHLGSCVPPASGILSRGGLGRVADMCWGDESMSDVDSNNTVKMIVRGEDNDSSRSYSFFSKR